MFMLTVLKTVEKFSMLKMFTLTVLNNFLVLKKMSTLSFYAGEILSLMFEFLNKNLHNFLEGYIYTIQMLRQFIQNAKQWPCTFIYNFSFYSPSLVQYNSVTY